MAAALYRPLSVLWDGARTWVGLAGYAADVAGPGGRRARVVVPARSTGRPPGPGRSAGRGRPAPSADVPAESRHGRSGGGWLAEVGVGVVHCTPEVAARLAPRPAPDAGRGRTCTRPSRPDSTPQGRLNPGRSVLAEVGT